MTAKVLPMKFFEDEIFAEGQLTAKTSKITSLENLYVYGM